MQDGVPGTGNEMVMGHGKTDRPLGTGPTFSLG
jgi:hypothetical protein